MNMQMRQSGPARLDGKYPDGCYSSWLDRNYAAGVRCKASWYVCPLIHPKCIERGRSSGWCLDRGEERSGGGRKPSISLIHHHTSSHQQCPLRHLMFLALKLSPFTRSWLMSSVLYVLGRQVSFRPHSEAVHGLRLCIRGMQGCVVHNCINFSSLGVVDGFCVRAFACHSH